MIERFGLQGFGATPYVLISLIEPRLYLAAHMIMDIAQGKAAGETAAPKKFTIDVHHKSRYKIVR